MKNFDSRPKAFKISKIIKENDSTNTYIFNGSLDGKPGQFVMFWIPGVDEKPFSIAFDDGKEFWITICNVGGVTAELFKLKEGDKVGIRGSFGTFYKFKKGEHLVLAAGGYGIAPMYFAANEAIKTGCTVDFVLGARTKNLLLFINKILALGSVGLYIATNDGSAGVAGFVTDALTNVLKEAQDKGKKIDKVFTCGPEVMMGAVGKVAENYNVKCFLSVEKYMKCGIGVCGQCAIDHTGVLACVKGPVMDYDYVKKLSEFGNYHRDAQGKKHHH